MLAVSRSEKVYSRARAKYLILPLTQRPGCAIMVKRLSMTQLKPGTEEVGKVGKVGDGENLDCEIET